MIVFILLPIFLGLILYVFKSKYAQYITLIIQFGLLVYLTMIGSPDTPVTYNLTGYDAPFGMRLTYDRLSFMMLLLNNLIFFVSMLYNLYKSYMNRLFLFIFLSVQGIINGIFLSSDLFNIYILMEVSAVAVSILIMYKKDSQSMYDGMIYLLANMFSMTFFLMGIGILYKQTGLLDIYTLKPVLNDPKTLALPYAFLLTGVSLKSAIMPLFSWLPKAHATASAPSIVSAVLSGIYVKTGIYLLIRLHTLFEVVNIHNLIIIVGFFTAILGFLFAISQKDIKRILAYHTISQIGLILIGIGSTNDAAFSGGIYHIFNHGIFKALLFLIAGNLTTLYHTRDITQMNNLWSKSKFLSIILMVAIFSITGAPFFSGSYSKYYIGYATSFHSLMIIINLGTLYSFSKFVHVILPSSKVSIDPHHESSDHAIHISSTGHSIMNNQKTSLMILALLSLCLGILGDFLIQWLVGFEGHLPLMSQLQKIPEYLILLAVTGILYHFKIHDFKLFKFFKGIDLNFNQICIAVVSFFALMFSYLEFIVI